MVKRNPWIGRSPDDLVCADWIKDMDCDIDKQESHVFDGLLKPIVTLRLPCPRILEKLMFESQSLT